MHPAEKYVDDVLHDKIISCKWVKLACQRYLDDKKNAKQKGFYFDESDPIRIIKFFERILKHYQDEWAGKPFLLLPWQQFVLWNLYGWKKKDGSRRFKQTSVFVARKNGKTELAAGCGLYGMGFDGTKAAEVYATATDKDQAKICWGKGKKMVQESKILLDYIQPMATAIFSEVYFSTFKPWSSDTGKKDGYNPSFAIIDEYHAHKDNSMMDVISSGLGGRTDPIIFMITTAGFSLTSPCYKHQKVCEEILEGKKHDESLFTVIYTIDEKDNWEDQKVWPKANPSWDAIPTIREQMLREYTKAKNSKNDVNFKTKNLNLWTQSPKTWIDDDDYMRQKADYNEDDLLGEICYGGLDLSDSYDLSCLSLFFPEHGKFLRYFFLPEDKLDEHGRADDVDYMDWVNDGWVTLTPGNVIDHNYIRYKITGFNIRDGVVNWDADCLMEKFDLRMIAFDRWGAVQIMNQLTDDGVEMLKHGQGYLDMNNPTKEIKKGFLGGELWHDGNPVSRWMFGNVVIRRDPAGNEKPDKEKSGEKIDGPVADIMALNCSLRNFEGEDEPISTAILL